jgi:hypothetical protein
MSLYWLSRPATTYQRLHGLLQFVHIDIVLLPLLLVLALLGFRRPRATGHSRRGHLAIILLVVDLILAFGVEDGASREKFLVEKLVARASPRGSTQRADRDLSTSLSLSLSLSLSP